MMSQSLPLPKEIEGVIPSLIERFKSGQISELMALFDPNSVSIADDGRTITDRAEITAINQETIKLGLPLKANLRHAFVAGDIAELVVDWSFEGTGPDGKHMQFGGTSCDIVRRGADGFWRFLIDNSQGTAVRKPA